MSASAAHTGIEPSSPACAIGRPIDDQHRAVGDERPQGGIVDGGIDRHHAISRARRAISRVATRSPHPRSPRSASAYGWRRVGSSSSSATAATAGRAMDSIAQLVRSWPPAAQSPASTSSPAPASGTMTGAPHQVPSPGLVVDDRSLACRKPSHADRARSQAWRAPVHWPPCTPGLEAACVTDETEIEQTREVRMMQTRQASAPQCPPELIGRSSDRRFDERHLVARREINATGRGRRSRRVRRGVGERDESVCNQPHVSPLHRAFCKKRDLWTHAAGMACAPGCGRFFG